MTNHNNLSRLLRDIIEITQKQKRMHDDLNDASSPAEKRKCQDRYYCMMHNHASEVDNNYQPCTPGSAEHNNK